MISVCARSSKKVYEVLTSQKDFYYPPPKLCTHTSPSRYSAEQGSTEGGEDEAPEEVADASTRTEDWDKESPMWGSDSSSSPS